MKCTINISPIQTEFTLKNSTSYAGSKPFLVFLEKIKLFYVFEQVGCAKKPNSLFSMSRILMYLIVGWLLGYERLFYFRSLQNDTLIRRFLGGKCPHYSLLYKELGRLANTVPTVRDDLRRINQQLISPHLPSELVLDFDSTVNTVFGNQEGAAVGVNPHKPGRKSYHPVMVYEGKSRFCLNAILRPGNTHSSTDILTFAKETLKLVANGHAVKYVRFDKGFGGEEFYRFWEDVKIGYVGKLKWTKRLQAEVANCRYWKRFINEDIIIEGITLVYQATSWKNSRFVVVIRKAHRQDEDQLQFYDFLWEYEAMVTNLAWEPIDIWRFYNQRACMENYIKEAKHGFSMEAISTSSFVANEIDLLLKLLAYNLFERFKAGFCDPVHRGFTIQRFRRDFLHVTGILITHSRKVILKMAEPFHNRQSWERIANKVALLI
ncbi:IS1380 family transposase [Brevibacillus sp. H7]|uniref:IS1380 family transposase n=1 Tax=Brevibacillus sp. H7 TaxID=3349138 RepID=UPI00381B51D8